MKKVPLEKVGEVLERIFDDEMDVRIEWDSDVGYVWALLGPNGPPEEGNPGRFWADHALEGPVKIFSADPNSGDMFFRAGRLMKDWHARGQKDTLPKAVTALAETAAKHKPKGAFAKWWKSGAPATELTLPFGMREIEKSFSEAYALSVVKNLANTKRLRGKHGGTWYDIMHDDLKKRRSSRRLGVIYWSGV